MAYLKPQSPIKFQEDHIYPLTTADQVILEDGSRWDGGAEANEKIENAQSMANDALSKAEDALSKVDDVVNSSGVQSVNGKKGDVTLDASDVGAAEAEHEHPYLPLDGGTIGGNVIFADGYGANSRFPCHYYHNLYDNNDRTTYVHAYPSPDWLEDGATRFDFRVANGSGSFDTLSERGGDGVYWNGSMLLDTGNYKNYCTPADIGAAPVSHTHNGKDVAPNIHNAGGTSGENGYVKIARFTITGQYKNQAISLKLTQRRQSYVTTLHILFGTGTDAALTSFTKDVNGYKCYMHKSSPGIWDLYVLKSEAYDSIGVVEYDCGDYMIDTSYSVTWTDEQISTLPSGYTEATLVKNQYNYIPDVNDGRNTTFAYSKSDPGTTSWFAVWNNSELRAMSPTNVRNTIGAAAASHTHNYAGSSSAGGPATAVDLPRTLANVNDIGTSGSHKITYIEANSSSSNLPTDSWYFIHDYQSEDPNYASQLAVGMTRDRVYYRTKQSGSWRAWKRLIDQDCFSLSGSILTITTT